MSQEAKKSKTDEVKPESDTVAGYPTGFTATEHHEQLKNLLGLNFYYFLLVFIVYYNDIVMGVVFFFEF
jgi:hypothetical protein